MTVLVKSAVHDLQHSSLVRFLDADDTYLIIIVAFSHRSRSPVTNHEQHNLYCIMIMKENNESENTHTHTHTQHTQREKPFVNDRQGRKTKKTRRRRIKLKTYKTTYDSLTQSLSCKHDSYQTCGLAAGFEFFFSTAWS